MPGKKEIITIATIATIVKHDSKILQINQAALSMLSYIALALLAHTYNCFFDGSLTCSGKVSQKKSSKKCGDLQNLPRFYKYKIDP